jgi:hypothetical protein
MGLARIIEPIEAVQRGDLVALGQCRVVEDRVYQRFDGPLESDNGLSDVNQFGRPFAYDRNTQQPARFRVKQYLHQPGSVV